MTQVQTDMIPIQVAAEYIESLSNKYNLSDQVKDMLLTQMRVLQQKYGEDIPKTDFLTVIGKQLDLLKKGTKREIVSVEEFVLSHEYLGLTNTVRPKVLEELKTIFGPKNHCYEVVLAGSTRWGKTYLSAIAMAYMVYKLSCLYSPQDYYKLSPNSEMILIFQSVTEAKALRNFQECKGMIENSPYFKNYFPPQGRSKKYLHFPGNIYLQPVSTSNTAAMSSNVFGGFLDEMNFYKIVKGSRHQGEDEQYFNQAERLYLTLKQRIENQFKDRKTGEWPGKIILASSANYENDFIDSKKKEAETNDKIHVAEYALWDVLEEDLSGKKFWIQLPTEETEAKILDQKPSDPLPDDVIEAPIEYQEQFEEDLIGNIRNTAGRPITRTSKFMPSAALVDCIDKYQKHYDGQQIFSVPSTELTGIVDLNNILNLSFIDVLARNKTQIHCHLDMALSQDAAGLALGATVGSKTVQEHSEYNEDTGEYEQGAFLEAPVYAIFGLIQLAAPEKGEIDIEKTQKLLYILSEKLPTFRSFSADFAYSASFRQNMKKLGLSVQLLSMDKNTSPYLAHKEALTQGRVWIPDHEVFKDEIKYLKQDLVTGKIDHQLMKSKDVADAVSGVVYKLSQLRMSYKIKGTPYTLKELKDLSSNSKEEKGRPHMNRPSPLSRPQGNKLWCRKS